MMACLCLSGGIIYLLPFLREGYYKPLQQALHLTHTQLGVLMSVLGTTSIILYFPGGWLADRISPKKLITFSMIATGLSGLYFALLEEGGIPLALTGTFTGIVSGGILLYGYPGALGYRYFFLFIALFCIFGLVSAYLILKKYAGRHREFEIKYRRGASVTNKRSEIANLENFRFPRLSDDECRRMHEASLEILERLGVRLDLKEAVDMLKKAGASVIDGNVVRVPSYLVERALTTAPKQVTLYDRQGNQVMPVSGHRCFFGPGSDCLNIIDHRTGERRNPVLKDVEDGVRLCDSLENIDFVMSMVLPADVEKTLADRYQMEVMLTFSTKPIIFVTYEMSGCRDAVQMAEVVAGGSDALRKKPIVACYINAVSGVHHNKEALQKLLFLASKNLPALYIPASTAAITSPVTPAGSVAMDYAGVLAGLVLSQLKSEGTPVIVTGMPAGGTFDMRTMVTSYCEPERTITQALSHFYGLPMFSIAGVSESKVVDQQAAAEAALSLVVETLAGGNIIHDLGYLESGLTFSLVQLAVCDEIVSWIKGFIKKFEVNDDTLALDVMAKIGPKGQFLDTDHTLKHYKDRWYPSLFERGNFQSWFEKGEKTLAERVADKIEQLLAVHKVEPLPDNLKEELKKIVQEAKRDDET